MGILLDEIDEFASLDEGIPVNNMCTVFAESEIIGLLSMQKDRSKFKILRNIIYQTIGLNVITHQHALFAGAIGACIYAKNKET